MVVHAPTVCVHTPVRTGTRRYTPVHAGTHRYTHRYTPVHAGICLMCASILQVHCSNSLAMPSYDEIVRILHPKHQALLKIADESSVCDYMVLREVLMEYLSGRQMMLPKVCNKSDC